jgi:hypothetical protein
VWLSCFLYNDSISKKQEITISNSIIFFSRKISTYIEALYREDLQGYIEFLLKKIHSEQRKMGCILESIKLSFASIYLVVDEDFGNFLKDLDGDFSLNLNRRWVGEMPKFELEEEHIV